MGRKHIEVPCCFHPHPTCENYAPFTFPTQLPSSPHSCFPRATGGRKKRAKEGREKRKEEGEEDVN